MDNVLEPSLVNGTNSAEIPEYLIKDNYLSEFTEDSEKAVVRENLNIYDKDSVYTKAETDKAINTTLKAALTDRVTNTELLNTVEKITDDIADAGYVRSDGSVPFTNVQSQSALPTKDNHLANKLYVDNAISKHTKTTDPHGTLAEVENILLDYIKTADIKKVASFYSKKEVDGLLEAFVKANGSVPFTKPQIGVDPVSSSHLATARYVTQLLENHKSEVNPHDILTILKSYLSNYYTKQEVYSKDKTYSRAQLLEIINVLMGDAVDQALSKKQIEQDATYISREELLTLLKSYVQKTDDIISKGDEAVEDDDYVILKQIEELRKELLDVVKETTSQTNWLTSGPVQSTVGLVEDNTVLPDEMTVQQIMDSIFYGKKTEVTTDPVVPVNEPSCIRIATHGVSTIISADIYYNDEFETTIPIADFVRSDDGSISYDYCSSRPTIGKVIWKVVFNYANGQTTEEEAETEASYPIFIGAMPYWENAQEDITIKVLEQRVEKDPENYKKIALEPHIESTEMHFNFQDVKQRNIIIVIPNDYPNLESIYNGAQQITKEGFTKWVQPMYPVEDSEVGVLYKIYVFKQPLVACNQTIKFQFEKENINE